MCENLFLSSGQEFMCTELICSVLGVQLIVTGRKQEERIGHDEGKISPSL